jgi:hemerythrin
MQWSDSLKIGDETVDMQHKQLVDTYNTLIEACRDGKGEEEIGKTLDFLCSYTVKHFFYEEALQQRVSFPEYEAHKQLHEDFKVKATQLAEAFKKDGYTTGLQITLEAEVGAWLLRHIQFQDSKIAKYISS